MTAINIIRQTDRIQMLTDGVWYGDDGKVKGIAPKVFLFPHIPAAMTMRGQIRHLANRFIEFALTPGSAVMTYGELLIVAGMSLKRIHDMMVKTGMYGDDDGRGELIFAGWSAEHGAFQTNIIGTCEPHAEDRANGMKSFELMPFPEIVTTPAPSLEQLVACGWNSDPAGADGFDVYDHGVKLMHAQRSIIAPMDNGQGKNGVTGHGVGGFIQLTTITRDEIASRIIHRWPDKIGERISIAPAGADVPPASATAGAAAAVPADLSSHTARF